LAFATLFLVATAFAHEDDTLDQLTSMANTKFGRTVLETIQLELQTKADPRPEIVRLLDDLIKDTTKQRDDNAAQYKKFKAEQEKIQKDAANRRDTATAVIEIASTNLTKAEKELGETEGLIKDAEKLIDTLKTDLKDKQAIRDKQHAHWEILDARYEKLISIFREVETILRNRIGARAGKKSSFLQKKATSEFINALAELKETITTENTETLTEGYAQLVSFIATKAQNYLTKITPESADAEAQSGLESVVRLCVKYQTKYENDRSEDAHIELERKLNFTAYKDAQLQKIAVHEDELATLNRRKADLELEISNLKQTISDAKTSKAQAIEDLKNSKIALKQATDNYEALEKQLSEELTLLNKILDIVNTRLTNLRKNVEKAIINSSIKA